jgi:hypothetical protein
VSAADGFDGGSDVRSVLLAPLGVAHLGEFLGGLKATGEGTVNELHGEPLNQSGFPQEAQYDMARDGRRHPQFPVAAITQS